DAAVDAGGYIYLVEHVSSAQTIEWGDLSFGPRDPHTGKSAETCKVRVVAPDLSVRTIAGGNCAFQGESGPALQMTFLDPWHIALDSDGNIYVTDTLAHRIRKLTPLSPQGSTLISAVVHAASYQ